MNSLWCQTVVYKLAFQTIQRLQILKIFSLGANPGYSYLLGFLYATTSPPPLRISSRRPDHVTSILFNSPLVGKYSPSIAELLAPTLTRRLVKNNYVAIHKMVDFMALSEVRERLVISLLLITNLAGASIVSWHINIINGQESARQAIYFYGEAPH